jgi:hypothetical protein
MKDNKHLAGSSSSNADTRSCNNDEKASGKTDFKTLDDSIDEDDTCDIPDGVIDTASSSCERLMQSPRNTKSRYV